MTDLVKKGTPFEWELTRQRGEWGRLQRALAASELELNAYRAQLVVFEQRYWTAFAASFAELDELEAQAAEKAAQWRPLDATKRRKAERLRARASGHALPTPQPAASPASAPPKPAGELKSAYRALSKQIHPDLASDPEARLLREALMAQANLAYASGDLERLRALADGWALESGPAGDATEETLLRLMRQIAQLNHRLGALAAERARLEASDLARLMRRTALAEEAGNDLFAKLAAEIEEEKRHLRKRLKTLERRLSKLAD